MKIHIWAYLNELLTNFSFLFCILQTSSGSSFSCTIVLSGLVTFSPTSKDECHTFSIKNWTSIIFNQFQINWSIDFPRPTFIEYPESEGIQKIIESSSWPRTCNILIIIPKILIVTRNKKWFLLYLSILELWARQIYEFWVIRLLGFNKLYKLLQLLLFLKWNENKA